MPKAKAKDDSVVLDFSSDADEGSDANPIDPATGETTFDDLSPRFVRALDEAVEKVRKKPAARPQETDDEDLDPSDEDQDDEDRRAREDDADEEDEDDERDLSGKDKDDEVDPSEEDEDADEPTPGRKGNAKFEKRLARADRLLDESRTQIAELQARDREREAKDKLNASESELKEFKDKTTKRLASLKALKIKAIDDGDTAAQVDIDDQITDAKADLRTKESAYESAKTAIEESTKRRGASPITITKVNQWRRKNPRFDTDPEFAEVVRGIDRALVAQNSNPESDEHYEAIDKRLKKMFPELAPRRKTPPRQHPSSQVTRESAPQRRQNSDARVTVKGDKIKISPAKLARVKQNMSRFGLDPTNPKDLKEYILNNPGL